MPVTSLITALASLAIIIVYSMAPESPVAPAADGPTPFWTPAPSGTSTPAIGNGHSLGDYLSHPLAKGTSQRPKSYLAGSKALDSLAKMIASTESFFHPSNSGSWTNDVGAFLSLFLLQLKRC
jgi:proteasome activator subunit 4